VSACRLPSPKASAGNWRAPVWLRQPKRRFAAKVGGARRDRTDDLLLAKQALSQLSYGPAPVHVGWLAKLIGSPSRSSCAADSARLRYASARQPSLRWRERRLVGLGRFELPTSRLSSARSNQLSYKPGSGISHQETGRMHCIEYLTPDP
jgi:hypothetical protein